MINKVEKIIKNVMVAVFKISKEEIKNDSSPDTIEAWDSLNHMNLVVALEEELEIEFSDDEILDMMNYALIKSVLMEKIN